MTRRVVEPLTMYQREQNYRRQEIARGGSSRRRATSRQWRRMLKKNGHAAARASRAEGDWGSA